MTYSVSVRGLCSFTAKQGDLDRRFTPAPSAHDGVVGHLRAAARRGAGYEPEISLTTTHKRLRIRGRADGYDAAKHRLDEFKTHRGAVERVSANQRSLHWAQLKAYGAMMCRRDRCEHIDLALVYVDVDTQVETVFKERFCASSLEEFFSRSCERFSEWGDRETRHRSARDAGLKLMRFPHLKFHAGQRRLAEEVYKGAHQGHCVLAQAPTGIGKTVGTLFPMLKAIAAGKIDKIFYVSAKTTGRRLALDALRSLKTESPATPLRVLDLVAREKACLHRDLACHAESCPLARGFYDRLASARAAALDCEVMDQSALRSVASLHNICPYYLSQEMARWADVIVGDYHYYFDGGGLLFGMMLENDWRVGVLVDEAHNLVERARLMNTAALVRSELSEAIDATSPPMKGPLQRVARVWNETCCDRSERCSDSDGPPRALIESLRDAAARVTDFAADRPGPLDVHLERFYFAALRFCRLCDSFGDHSLFDRRASDLTVRNVVPAKFLRTRFESARSVALFSATLDPAQFYMDLLGLPSNTRCIDVPSPFEPAQLSVHAVSISTRFHEREASLAPISALVGRVFAAKPGNYIVYVSSHDYLQVLFEHFSRCLANVPAWAQRRSMSEDERREFVDRFTERGRGVAFAVLGGAFAEGIDLPGTRLIGAFIATLGMPQVNAVNEAIAARVQSTFGAGHEYTYLYPGLQKVTQAAGRVIRTTSDHGSLYLIDPRYALPSVRRHLPSWWRVQNDADPTLFSEQPFRLGDDVVDRYSQFLQHDGTGRRGAKSIDPDGDAVASDIFPPSQGRTGLD